MDELTPTEEINRALEAFARTFADNFFVYTPAQHEAYEIAKRHGLKDVVEQIERNRRPASDA